MCLSAAQWGGHGALPGMNRTDNDFRQVHFTASSFPSVFVSFLSENTLYLLRIPALLMSSKVTVVKTCLYAFLQESKIWYVLTVKNRTFSVYAL